MMREALPVAVMTLGCKVNRVESEMITAQLLGRECRITREDEAAVVILNTCSVTGEADRKTRKAVRRALRRNEETLVIATGCLAVSDGPTLEALGERLIIETDKDAIADIVAARFGLPKGPPVVRASESFRTRGAVKIQDGCDCFCTYCIVPHVRGLPRSRPIHEIISEVEGLVAAGLQEIVLTGINIGSYLDREGEDPGASQTSTEATVARTFPDVVRAIARSGVSRVRLSSIEPPDITDELLEVMASEPSVCPHLHVPLQSGSDRVLAAMGRRYDSARFIEIVERARARVPGLVLTTDVMVGFPGETEADFAATLSLVERVAFTKLHVFRYSMRPNTPAASMRTQVRLEEKSDRSERLRELGERLLHAYMETKVGTTVEVLVEAVDVTAEGMTSDYLRVNFPGVGAAPGDRIAVLITGVDDDRLTGTRAPS